MIFFTLNSFPGRSFKHFSTSFIINNLTISLGLKSSKYGSLKCVFNFNQAIINIKQKNFN
jgi:hypothetical protein